MPMFEVSVARRVTERADILVEADSQEDAWSKVNEDIEGFADGADWWMCDCQDEGQVFSVQPAPASAEAGS